MSFALAASLYRNHLLSCVSLLDSCFFSCSNFYILFFLLAVRSHFLSVAIASNFTYDGFPWSRKAAAAHQFIFRGRHAAQFWFCTFRIAETSCPQQGCPRSNWGPSAVFPFHHQKKAKWLCLASWLFEISSMQGLMQKEFLKYPFVHLDALREGSKEVHPVMAGTSMALVRFDDVDLVPHPFLDKETVVVKGLVSDGLWLSLAHTEIMGGGNEQRFDAARIGGVDDFDIPDGVDFIWEKVARLVPICQHHLKPSTLYGKKDLFS